MKRHKTIYLALFIQLSLILISITWAFSPKIDYREVLTPIFEKNAIGMFWMTNSADGSKIAFTTTAEHYIANNDRLYVMNTDGTELTDLTSKLIDILNVRDLVDFQLNKYGSRLIFRSKPLSRIYIFNTDKGELIPFFIQLERSEDWRKSFGINAKGNRIYYRDFIWLDENSRPGLYKCTVPDSLVEPQGCIQYLNIDQLPGGTERPDVGPLLFLGHSIDADRTLFTWSMGSLPQSIWVIDDTGLYPGPINFIPKKVTFDVQWLWSVANLPNEIISADGRLALAYISDPLFGTVPKLFVVDLDSKAEKPTLFKLLAEVYSGGGLTWPHISPSGRYARFTCGGFNFTRYDLLTDEMRDTASLCFDSTIQMASNITENDRYYFIYTSFLNSEGSNVVQIYRVDMEPTDFSNAPNITDINFINRGLTNAGDTNATVTAFVSDAQGDSTIEWVRLMGLLNGIEKPGNSGEPFYFQQTFFDNGTNGDIYAGDGIYTNSSVVAVKEFFQTIAKPIKIGIRIVARDIDGHYTIVDSVIKEQKGIIPIPALQSLLLND
jgi:hypothetical protein